VTSEQEVERVIQAAARMLFKAAARVLNTDPHQWSSRPCETCRVVTGVLGEPFGCDAYREANRGK
jgi:hypothetical protein